MDHTVFLSFLKCESKLAVIVFDNSFQSVTAFRPERSGPFNVLARFHERYMKAPERSMSVFDRL
jgi:hypothetical protein